MRLLLLAIVLACFAGNGFAAERPNILLIMADDLRDYGGAFTREVVKSPNLDRLRARGTTFARAYVQYPVCNPSRSSMMTGLRAEQTGIVGNDIPLRQKRPGIITMPQLCKDAGWQTHAFGKLYHLGGGKDPAKQTVWMDTGRSWHTAQAFDATKAGRTILQGRNVTGGALNWCHWGAADGTDDDQSIRTTRWRFTHWSDVQTELYDHDNDPEELHNVASQHPDVAKGLMATLRKIPKPQP